MLFLVWTELHPGLRDRIERHILVARAAIIWERIWPALWPASGILGAFAAAALLGLFGTVGTSFRIPLLLAVLGASGWLVYRNLRDFREPDWAEGARRLERDSALPHRPLTERNDTLALGSGDPLAEALWRAHVRDLLARQDRLRFVIPHAGLASRDPYFARYIVLALLIVGLVVAGRDWGRRLVAGFSLGGSGTSNATLDAWVDPPNYTGLAPIYLPHGDHSDSAMAVPAGSTLALRVHGSGMRPSLVYSPWSRSAPNFTGQGDDYSGNSKLTRNERVAVAAGGVTLGAWTLHAIPDRPPTIRFAAKPSKTERDAVKFDFITTDDYGVIAARALIKPVKGGAHPRILMVDLPLSQTNAKQARETVYRDLTADPYAGLEVEVTLEARDGAGNIAHSTPVRFTLPARVFTNPLARALIEQRQNLSLSPSGRNTAMRALDALTLAPDKFFDEKSMPVYVGMRAAYWGLKNARHPSDIAHVQDLLWQMAMALERGGLSSAAEELRQLQQMISQALAQGAPQAVIDALLQRYQQALNKYLQMLAQNPPPSDQKLPPGSKVLKSQDLQALLNAIQQLSQMGDREHAQQLLAMLQSLLENLHMTAGAGGSAQDQEANKTLQGLSDLMGKQRQLMDKTFREQQGNPDPKSGGPKGLSQQQGQLRDQLNKLMQGEGKQGGPGGKELGEAQKQMGQAQGELGNRSLDDAQQSEKQALDSMRQGAGQIAKQMMGQNGKEGESGGNEDPLGREGNGPSLGKGVKIPDKSAVERARNILKELRKRAEERGRPKEELDYIDRLLKQF
jgi:uncharacterized protein (TIGR02302 family)